MKQTAVEWLVNEIQTKHDKSFLEFYGSEIEQAKEMEKEQLECAWNSSDQNMRFQFSSSAYKGITFKQWLEKYEHER
jgi:hypothetical protein